MYFQKIDLRQVVSPFQGIVDFEKANNIPLGYINYAISRAAPNGSWHRLERGEIKLDENFFRGFKADLENEQRWREYHQELKLKAKPLAVAGAEPLTVSQLPPLPSINTEKLFWAMMTESRHVDPHMFPALQKLKASGKFLLAALSNTVIFPPGSPIIEVKGDVREIFDVFVSSAHVGMRKPDPRIYKYTMEKLRETVGPDLKAEEVLFLDDIGENLKAAKALGMRTIKVWLRKTDQAVKELENAVGMDLQDDITAKAKL